MTFDQQTKN